MNKGFIALTFSVTVMGILLGLIAASSIRSADFYDQAMKKIYREMNYYFAYDCIDRAILSLAHDYFFEVSTPLAIPEFHCDILSVSKQDNEHIILTRGTFKNAYVYRRAFVRLGNHTLDVVKIE